MLHWYHSNNKLTVTLMHFIWQHSRQGWRGELCVRCLGHLNCAPFSSIVEEKKKLAPKKWRQKLAPKKIQPKNCHTKFKPKK
jgi:hypothetical protein